MVIAADAPTNAIREPGSARSFRTLFFVAAAWNLGGAVMGLLFLEPLAHRSRTED